MTAAPSARYDAIVVGGGHNGLVCAAYLARDGLRTLLVERREHVGGAVGTHELMAGVRVPDLAHAVGRLAPTIARDLDLRGHRVRLVQPDARMLALSPDARPLTLWGDPDRTAQGLADLSAADAARYREFDTQTRALSGLLGRLMAMTPPDPSRPGIADALTGLRLGVRYRGLGAVHGRALLRVLPMPIADHLEDWFTSPELRAALAWRGVRYSSLGPRDAGTSQSFLADSARTGSGAAGDAVLVRGGPGALAEGLASAARGFGCTIWTSAEARSIAIRDDRASGVVLSDGREIHAGTIVSGLDPKRTLLELVDPAMLGPLLGWQVGNLRQKGSVSKVDLALADLPAFTGMDGAADGSRTRGRILVLPSVGALDRAADSVKAGRLAEHPLLEATIPSLIDASLVQPGAQARHVMSILVQGTPYHRRDGKSWDTEREALGDAVVAELEAVAPRIGRLIVGRRVVTPLDLERGYGLTEGHPLHGEPALDQWFAWRPMLGFARYRLPVEGLYLCGSGAHPGGGVTGWPGRNAAREIIADRRRRP